MPEKRTLDRAQEDLREGKGASTAAGEFVREEMHGAKSTKQAIAIGLSKARRAGVPLKPPAKGQTPRRTRTSAMRAYEVGQGTRKPRSSSRKRSRAVLRVMKGEGRSAASRSSLSRQAKTSARTRRGTDRSP